MSVNQPAAVPPPAAVAPGQHVLVPALAAQAAAIVGGVVWALVVETTGYEIGFAAVGIGFTAGLAAAATANGRVSPALPFVAGGVAALGVLLGKVLAIYLAARDVIAQYGADASAFTLTRQSLTDSGLWSLFDILWLALAVMAAYRFVAARVTAAAGPGTTVL